MRRTQPSLCQHLHNSCTSRQSNPGLYRGRVLFYHQTTGASVSVTHLKYYQYYKTQLSCKFIHNQGGLLSQSSSELKANQSEVTPQKNQQSSTIINQQRDRFVYMSSCPNMTCVINNCYIGSSIHRATRVQAIAQFRSYCYEIIRLKKTNVIVTSRKSRLFHPWSQQCCLDSTQPFLFLSGILFRLIKSFRIRQNCV